MDATQSGQAVNTYPAAMINAGIADPSSYEFYRNAGAVATSPLSVSPVVYTNVPIGGIGAGGSTAYNYVTTAMQSQSGSYSVPSQYGTPRYGDINGSITADLTGQLVYYFKATWIGSGTPPGYIDLLLQTNVQAYASVDYEFSAQQYGLSALATATDGPPFNETASASAGDGGLGLSTGPVVGYHLVRAAVDPKTSIAEAYVNGMAHTQVVNSVCFSSATGLSNGATISVSRPSITASVKPDDREVTITSPDIETSYQFGPFNTTTNTYPPNVRASNGSIVVDSAVSPPLTQPGGGTTWTASPGLIGQAGSFQNPVFAWSLTGEGSLSASGNTSHTQLSVSFPLSPTDTVLNKQSVVRLDVADSDRATAANTFTVQWHYPYENWRTYGAQFQNSPIAFPSTGPAAVNGQVSIPMTSPSNGITLNVAGKILGGFLTTAGSVIGVTQPETDPLFMGFLASSGYTLSVLDPPSTPAPYTETGTPAQFQTDVATQVAINQDNTSGIFLPARPRMQPGLAAMINAAGNYGSYTSDTGGSLTFDCTAYREQMQQNYTGDSYGQHGYLGPAAGSVTFPGPWQYVWNWSWTPTTSPSP